MVAANLVVATNQVLATNLVVAINLVSATNLVVATDKQTWKKLQTSRTPLAEFLEFAEILQQNKQLNQRDIFYSSQIPDIERICFNIVAILQSKLQQQLKFAFYWFPPNLLVFFLLFKSAEFFLPYLQQKWGY